MKTETAFRDHYVINIEVPGQTLRDLLVTAVEGGSGYWASFSNIERDEDLNILKVKVTELEKSRADQPRANRYIQPFDLANGIERLARAQFPTALKHLGDALGDHDATTADVVLQMAIFGEVIYG